MSSFHVYGKFRLIRFLLYQMKLIEKAFEMIQFQEFQAIQHPRFFSESVSFT